MLVLTFLNTTSGWNIISTFGTHLDVGQFESCVVCLSLVLSLMSTEPLSEVLMSTMSLTVIFVCGLVPGLGPLWSPSCVVICLVSGRPFTQIQAQV